MGGDQGGAKSNWNDGIFYVRFWRGGKMSMREPGSQRGLSDFLGTSLGFL